MVVSFPSSFSFTFHVDRHKVIWIDKCVAGDMKEKYRCELPPSYKSFVLTYALDGTHTRQTDDINWIQIAFCKFDCSQVAKPHFLFEKQMAYEAEGFEWEFNEDPVDQRKVDRIKRCLDANIFFSSHAWEIGRIGISERLRNQKKLL